MDFKFWLLSIKIYLLSDKILKINSKQP
jgi:hypothetical protein